MKFPNPAVRLPQWWWLHRFDRWRCERGLLTGRWTPEQIAAHRLRAAHWRALLTFSDCPEDPDF